MCETQERTNQARESNSGLPYLGTILARSHARAQNDALVVVISERRRSVDVHHCQKARFFRFPRENIGKARRQYTETRGIQCAERAWQVLDVDRKLKSTRKRKYLFEK